MTLEPGRRMRADDRRESILRAAGAVFGRNGYAGTTTDQVARAAGISQPYVVRMFGSKEALFLAVLERAERALLAAFRAALDRHRAASGPDADLEAVLGEAYQELIGDDGIHLPLMQGFMQGDDPVVGARARAGFLAVWRLLVEEAGLSPERARDFLGHGMLINVVLGLQLQHDDDRAARDLVAAAHSKDAFERAD